MNKPFLQQVAEYYVDNGIDLSNYVFVLPNTRSGKFMRMYLRLAMRHVAFMPKIVSITYFTQQYCDRPLGNNVELVMMLYQTYNQVLKDHGRKTVDFDSFAFWGNMLLNDFSDVDAYLADAKMLFKNLRDEQEIRSSYLTEEQRQVIEELLGIKIDMDPEVFWQHMRKQPKDGSSKEQYLAFWEIMGELYERFNAQLAESAERYVYPGLQSKLAYERIKELGSDDLRGTRYAFIGFNALSTSRLLIFKHLHDIHVADFFWDTSSPYVRAEGSSAGRFVMPLSRKLPMPFELAPVDTRTQVQIISVPSNVGQANAATSIMNEWELDRNRLIQTGIVLADTSMLVPMLYALPDDYQPINVTMGMPYAATPFAGLLDSIFKMLHRARHDGHETYYMASDIDEVLSHPNITAFAEAAVVEVKKEIAQSHMFYVSSSQLLSMVQQAPGCDLSFLFMPIREDAGYGQAHAYLDTLISKLRDETVEYIKQLKAEKAAAAGIDPATIDNTDTEDDNESEPKAYELVILDAYRRAIDQLAQMAERYKIQMRDNSFFSLLRKVTVLGEIPFSGDPVKGLQMMDIMDARLLDFDNVVLLSANERVLPRKSARPSLILATLRRGYGLPTQEDDECSSAYQFFRMISRASRVALIYDARTAGVSSGEMSRYLSQLLYMPLDVDITVRTIKVNPQSGAERQITIEKTDEVMAELDGFKPGGDLNLSASALKTYLMCPLRFYLQFVKLMRLENPAPEYMDPTSFGTVVHDTAEVLYGKKERLIDVAAIDAMLKENIYNIVLEQMRRRYYKQAVTGEGEILAGIITKYIRKMLELERRQVEVAPYTFVAAEYKGAKKVHEWQATPEHKINFTMSIDRLDRLAPKNLRFIDYKTGADNVSTPSLDALLTDHDCGGMFQVFAYCLAYCELTGYDGAIKPMIYRFTDMIKKDEIVNLKVNKKDVIDFAQVRKPFTELFRKVINDIMGREVPFSQTDNHDNCTFCPFVHMCGRYQPPTK